MKFPLCNWNLYWVTNFVWIYGWIFTHCIWQRIECCIVCKSSWIIHRIRGTDRHRGKERMCQICACVSVLKNCYQFLRRVAGCPSFWTKFSGSSRSGFSPLFTPWLPSVQTILTHQFSNSATTGIGENSPTTYALQGSSMKTWVNFQPGHMSNLFFYYFYVLLLKVFIFHKCTQSSASTRPPCACWRLYICEI